MKARKRDSKNHEAAESKSYEAKEMTGCCPCAYPEDARSPAVENIDSMIGFTDNSAHAANSANKSKNKGISKTHDR